MNATNQKTRQTAIKAGFVSIDIGSNRGILKKEGVNFGTLHRRIVLQSSRVLATMASLKPTKRE